MALKCRSMVERAVVLMCRELELENLEKADELWGTAIKADVAYMKMWHDGEKCLTDLLMNTASEYEKKGDKKIADYLLYYATTTDEI